MQQDHRGLLLVRHAHTYTHSHRPHKQMLTCYVCVSLQKLLTEEERKDGVSTKVCKKSVMRLIRALSREGLLKLYRTIVIQDGVHKKVHTHTHKYTTHT